MNHTQIVVVGGGQMGRALVCGMLDRKVIEESQIQIVEPSEASQEWWGDNRPKVKLSNDLADSISNADTVVLAVKPTVMGQVAKQSRKFWNGKLVVSIAAGITLETLCGWISHRRVIRVMPNTPCLVGEGASAFCGADEVTGEDKAWVESLLSSVGKAYMVDESQMDAVTGLSGSGPAYICLVIESLADGGVAAGLPRALAMQLATQTVLGTAKMVAETGRHPAELKDSVASPGGTTIAGLQVLEQNGFRAAMIDAVTCAARRSRELAAQ